MLKLLHLSPCVFIFSLILTNVLCENKYSEAANRKADPVPNVDFRTLEKPYRMHKLNMVWLKAQQRLTEPKLKSLYSDLMIQDKDEITLKRVKSEGGDKEGFKEAELRKKLANIMDLYGLREHFEDNVQRYKQHQSFNSAQEDHINKSLFKDKKLNQLWAKAEASGFTSEELGALKEEFMHHQDKIDQYYDMLSNMENEKGDGYDNAVNEEEIDKFNEVNLETNEIKQKDDTEFVDKANQLRDKHRKIRDGYDRLQRITAKGPNNKDFVEPKVQGLWKMAVDSKFTPDELESLKVELHHYESRLLKLRHLHAESVRNVESQHSKVAAAGDKMDHFDHQQQMIKKHSLKVNKMHSDLESRILAKHSEL